MILLTGHSLAHLQSLSDLLMALTSSKLPHQTDCSVLTFDNKYYSVDTHLAIYELDGDRSETTEAPEAVVLVFDATAPGDFDQVRAWWQGSALDESAEVKMAVAVVPSSSGAECEPQLDTANIWCAEEHFELVTVDEGLLSEGRASDVDVTADAEDGIGRLIQALESHMWPGMKLKTSGPRGFDCNDMRAGLGADGVGSNDDFGNYIGVSEGDPELDELEKVFLELTSELLCTFCTLCCP